MYTTHTIMVRAKATAYRNREHLIQSEIDTLLMAAQLTGRYCDRNHAMVLMIFRHGLRITEAASLEWKDVDFIQKQIYIQRAKGSESGTHPLQDDEIEALQKLKRVPGVPQVFTSERGGSFLVDVNGDLQAPGIARTIERIGKKSNLDIRIHAHMLRHSCGYYLVNKGYDLRLIQGWLGHKNIGNTVRYTHLSAERFRAIQWV